jgi:hypothetical protein
MSEITYIGDIIPYKQLHKYGWIQYPFYFECKTGYKEHTPTFWSYLKIEEWYKKAYFKIQEHSEQKNIVMVLRFLSKPILVVTDYQIDINKLLMHLIIPIKIEENIITLNVYKYKELLNLPFNDLFSTDLYG